MRVPENDNNNVELAILCREGPLPQRKCTDFICCFLYILLIAAVIFLAFFAGRGATLTPSEVEQQLTDLDSSDPLLSITASLKYILLSLTVVLVLSLLLVITSFIIPAIAVYIFIPLILILMLLLGVGFLYRYFGKQLPFIDQVTQQAYIASHSVMSLIIGVAFCVGFIVALIVLFLKQQRLGSVVTCLSLAKICFWENPYMILVSISMSAISIGALYLNIWCLQVAALQKDGQDILNKWIFGAIVLAEMVWTHGYLQAYSDFIFESIAIHWYYAEKKYGKDYSRLGNCLCPTLGLSFKHIGTIVFGWVLALIPDSLNMILHRCEQKSETCYSIFCCFHKCLCENLSKYCYVGTVMYSYSFCEASREVKNLRITAKHTFPELYMIGNFYITLVKLFIVLTSLIVCYFFMAENGQRYAKVLNLITPLIVTLLGSLQIATHFLNSTGLVGDSLYLTYTIDYNCESSNFGQLNAEHCPQQAYQIIKSARVGKYNTAQ